MKRLVIVGNGFDLGHDLKTRFIDFINSNDTNSIKYKKLSGMGDDKDWNKIEENFKRLLLNDIKKVEPIFLGDELENKFDEFEFNKYEQLDYVLPSETDNFDNEINSLMENINILERFENEFAAYLKEICNLKAIREIKPREKILKILENTYLVINFNYTYLIENIYQFKNVIHIHGDLNKNNIFIGTESLDGYKESVIDDTYPADYPCENKYDYQEKMKYYDDVREHLELNRDYLGIFEDIKSINTLKEKNMFDLLDKKNKETLPLRKSVKERLKKEKYDEVYVLGHSLGDADFEVLNCINKDAKFYCFYYGDKPNEIMERTLKRLGVESKTIPNGDLYEVIKE